MGATHEPMERVVASAANADDCDRALSAQFLDTWSGGGLGHHQSARVSAAEARGQLDESGCYRGEALFQGW